MGPKRENLRALIEETIPFLKKVVVKLEAMEQRGVRLRLPHDRASDNYVGMTHAGAIFTFGETCAGVAAGAAFDLTRLRMLARRAEITYRKPVTGDLHAAVEIAPEAVTHVEGEVEREGRATLPVTVQMENTAGETVAEMTVDYDFECLEGSDPAGHLKVASLALTEPDAGSDISRITTTAVRDGEHYVINGRKQFATNGSVASAYIVRASVDHSAGRAGLRAFIVPRDTAGLIPGDPEQKLGIRASDTASVTLEDCRVPVISMLGSNRARHGGAKRVLDATRPLVGALALGVARAALEVATDYARERVQFGEPIAKKQGIAFLLADMATEIEAARALVWQAVWLADHGIPNTAVAAMSKAKAAAVAMDVTGKAVQILGGYGFCRGYPVEKWFRDAKIMDIFEGTGQIQRTIIAQELTGLDCK